MSNIKMTTLELNGKEASSDKIIFELVKSINNSGGATDPDTYRDDTVNVAIKQYEELVRQGIIEELD